jgi:two-component system sensor histidine kinase MprB
VPSPRRSRILDRLQAQATEFTDLVNELAELARDTRSLVSEEVPMAVVVEQAVDRARSRAADHVFDVEMTPWSTTGDAAACERAVLNVLDNAIKFAPPRCGACVHTELPVRP